MPPTRTAAALLLLCTVSGVACSRRDATPRAPQRETAAPTPAPTPAPPVTPAPPAPDSFLVALTTSRGPVAVLVHRFWAPPCADRVYGLVRGGVFDNARFFPLIRWFVVLFR